MIGYRGKKKKGVVDVEKREENDVIELWEKIYDRGENEIVIEKDELYIIV